LKFCKSFLYPENHDDLNIPTNSPEDNWEPFKINEKHAWLQIKDPILIGRGWID